MPSLSEIHGLIVHLPLLAVPVLALLVALERLGRGGDLVRRTQPWVLAAGAAGAVVAVLSGLLVLGGAQQTLRGSTGRLVWIHLGLGVVLALVLLLLGWLWWRAGQTGAPAPAFGARAGIAATALLLTVAVGYVGGKMVYAQGVGVEAGGQFAQTARGAALLAAGLATNADRLALGKQAYQTGLGCGSCHGMQAQGGRAPALAGGVELDGFRGSHGKGLYPASVLSDRMFQVVEDWLKTLADHPAATEG